jgi:hypothetical protein
MGREPHVALYGYVKNQLRLTCSCGWTGGAHREHDRARRHFERHLLRVEREQQ